MDLSYRQYRICRGCSCRGKTECPYYVPDKKSASSGDSGAEGNCLTRRLAIEAEARIAENKAIEKSQ